MSISSAHRGQCRDHYNIFFQDGNDGVDNESLLHADQEALPALSAGDINVEPSADIPDGEPVTTACTQTLSLHQTKSTQMDTAEGCLSELNLSSRSKIVNNPNHATVTQHLCRSLWLNFRPKW